MRRDKSVALLAVVLVLTFLAPVVSFCQGDPDIVDITGRVQRYTYDGGFYGIEGDDGKAYKPLRLSEGFQIEGLRVSARVRVVNKRLLTSGWGIPVEVLDIRRIR